jgi:tRNA U34 5-methylaminomethyl-2-thiouridine-forming methyltransferase MnmC
MDRRIIETSDGSRTLYLPELNETYHSRHGAVQESRHVFIDQGYKSHNAIPLRILELGLGTGLNALLTWMESQLVGRQVEYQSVEAYPCTVTEALSMNYSEFLTSDPKERQQLNQILIDIHQAEGGIWTEISSGFCIRKWLQPAADFPGLKGIDLIYYDAFGARVQPELWELSILEKFTESLSPGGIFVTYSAKGSLRRNLEDLGLRVERLPGPPGKREMIRAIAGR